MTRQSDYGEKMVSVRTKELEEQKEEQSRMNKWLKPVKATGRPQTHVFTVIKRNKSLLKADDGVESCLSSKRSSQ